MSLTPGCPSAVGPDMVIGQRVGVESSLSVAAVATNLQTRRKLVLTIKLNMSNLNPKLKEI